MKFVPFLPRLTLAAALIACIGEASALGLGEMRTRSALGERFAAEVEVLARDKDAVDASCFRLHGPASDGELPWLHRAALALRRGTKLVLEIRSDQALRDPVLQIGIQVGCGYDVQRDYTLFLSPRGKEPEPALPEASAPPVLTAQVPRRTAPLAEAMVPVTKELPRRLQKAVTSVTRSDALVLSGGADRGDAPLHLASDLAAWRPGDAAQEARRETLRLEYRLLAALNEQVTSQLAAADKLRAMEENLAGLRTRTDDLAGRIEKGVALPDSPPPPAQAAPPVAVPAPGQAFRLSEWSFYGALLGVLVVLGSWLGWQQYRQRREPAVEPSGAGAVEAPVLGDTPRPPAPPAWVRKPGVEPAPEPPGEVHGQTAAPALAEPEAEFGLRAANGGKLPSGYGEANPVMELAEIMLSFGRVKGAAQALQEYIDHNPEEALQPWIRLMDVYRLAGLREQFERVALDLNRHFNVEVQHWDKTPADWTPDRHVDEAPGVDEGPAVSKALSLEEVEHVRQTLIDIWDTPECREYLDRLLRDNRGGQRSGFTLPVVEEIMFLQELLDTKKSIK